jgi:hypothetical protein
MKKQNFYFSPLAPIEQLDQNFFSLFFFFSLKLFFSKNKAKEEKRKSEKNLPKNK